MKKNMTLPLGMQSEVGCSGQEWLALAVSKLKRGLLLTIDYGDAAQNYYHPSRFQGTLVGYRAHRHEKNVLKNPGEIDLTADVDFSALKNIVKSSTMSVYGYTTLAWYLVGLGLLDRVARQMSVADEQNDGLRQTVKKLLMPQAMGETFKVLAAGRGIGEEPLLGFAMQNRWEYL